MTRTLILIPTAQERDILLPQLEAHLDDADQIELCGFGLVAAAAQTSRYLGQLHPERVLLLGIAGTLVDRLPVGSAGLFHSVACFGIGAGSGIDHQTAGDMGWYHVGGRPSDAGTGDITIGDTLTLGGISTSGDKDPEDLFQLLTVASASESTEEAAWRCRRFPDVAAEDMEGFAVAVACRLHETPLAIVRGISNRAGDRDAANWKIRAALESAAELAAGLL